VRDQRHATLESVGLGWGDRHHRGITVALDKEAVKIREGLPASAGTGTTRIELDEPTKYVYTVPSAEQVL
jgi:hypothetical protein